MPAPILAPFGTWVSPITSGLVASAQVQLLDVLLDQATVYWVEGRPQEGGRQVLVRQDAGGQRTDLTPPSFSVRTRVHEYGGAAVVASAQGIFFSNFADQRLYRLGADGQPHPLTPASDAPGQSGRLRYADGAIDLARRLWIGIREDHTGPGMPAVNCIVAIDIDTGGPGSPLVQGSDFYASPRLSPDGRMLAWLAWNDPAMPWIGTELWLGAFTGRSVTQARRIAGGPDESVFQPEWAPDGVLHYVSDRSGWWNIYRQQADGSATNVCPMAAEFGRPQWALGMSTYAFLSAREIVCSYIANGAGRLARLDLGSGALTPFDLPYAEFFSIRARAGRVAFRAGGPTTASAVLVLDPSSGHATPLRQASTAVDDPAMARHLSVPRLIEFPTEGNRVAFGLFYAPCNADYQAPAGTLPPLLVRCHGGPTSSASRSLDLRTQFWTSRGIAVVDVDYGGSTGYGRAYQERLRGMWGIVDVQDCAAAVRFLVEMGWTDGARTMISGSSAGGFTALSCLTCADPTLRQLFHAGASHYGVSDLQALARDTHKFEAHYLDWLVGPPAGDAYRSRSPMRNASRLSAPVVFFQGSEDRIVPPDQTERMVSALRERGITAQYLLFGGEQHGFRKAQNIQWVLDAEAYFYDALVLKRAC